MVKVLIGFAMGIASVGACIWCYKKGFEAGVKKCNDIVKKFTKDADDILKKTETPNNETM
jgi:hypothetical protein